MLQKFPHRLLQGSKVPREVRDLLQIPDQKSLDFLKASGRRGAPKYVKGVRNGNFFKVKIPPPKKPVATIPKLPSPTPMPKPLSKPPPPAEATPRTVTKWLRSNGPILMLNFGSMCTLLGFMRSDVLELRSLALTGNVMFILYVLQQNPILWASIGWSSTFASVNLFNIVKILHERNAEVHMDEKEQNIFVSHFMSHGVTPKQFERIMKKAKKLTFPKGDIVVRSGQNLDHVYLVVSGSTRALVLGRFVTAASTNAQTKRDRHAGGDSGAWIGEMAFLDRLWELEQGKKAEAAGPDGTPKKVVGAAIYTVEVEEDCTVLSWSHEDMTELMSSSADLRSAMTRAMTSALVGKVVNLTVSRTQKGLPRWSGWLSDWRDSGAKVELRDAPPEDNLEPPPPTPSIS